MEIRSAQYLISSPGVAKCPPADRPEFAFIGRSNVGKSSLINMLTRNSKLAKTSASPGKTQMINHFSIQSTAGETPAGQTQSWYLVDLPGYGFAKVSLKQRASFQKMISEYLLQRSNLISVFVLVDSRIKPQQIDLDFMAQLGEWGIPFSIAFTKADKSTQKEVAANVKAFLEKMKKEWEFIPPSFVTSAAKFLGRKELLRYLDELIEAGME
jgi:GTP-binding protein